MTHTQCVRNCSSFCRQTSKSQSFKIAENRNADGMMWACGWVSKCTEQTNERTNKMWSGCLCEQNNEYISVAVVVVVNIIMCAVSCSQLQSYGKITFFQLMHQFPIFGKLLFIHLFFWYGFAIGLSEWVIVTNNNTAAYTLNKHNVRICNLYLVHAISMNVFTIFTVQTNALLGVFLLVSPENHFILKNLLVCLFLAHTHNQRQPFPWTKFLL